MSDNSQQFPQSITDDGQALSPEQRLRVKEIIDAMQHPLAVNCQITFNWSGNQELADQASWEIRVMGALMREQWPEMSFERLKGITFHHDYELALAEAAGSRRDAPVPTREAAGFSVGMMVHSGDYVQLVMHESVALSLVAADDAAVAWAQSVVRHELCHVVDAAFKRQLIEKNPDNTTFSGFAVFMAPLAESMWDEYFANKYSYGRWTDVRMFLDLLRNAVEAIRSDVIEAILCYRLGQDLQQLRTITEPKVRFVAQCIGYAAGALAGKGVTLEQEAPELADFLERMNLMKSWCTCVAVLDELDGRRPNWKSALDLSDLFPSCVELFGAFGLHYRPQGEAAYIHVPETQETSIRKAVSRVLAPK